MIAARETDFHEEHLPAEIVIPARISVRISKFETRNDNQRNAFWRRDGIIAGNVVRLIDLLAPET